MNTLYTKNLREKLHEVNAEGFMGKEIIIEKNLHGVLMRLHDMGFKCTFFENPDLDDYDDDCFFIDEPQNEDALLHRIVYNDNVKFKRRNDLWFTFIHMTHYTDGIHEAYVATLI